MMNEPYDTTRSDAWQNSGLQEVSGIFRSRRDLERLLDELDDRGLRESVSVLMTDETRSGFGQEDSYGDNREDIRHSSKLPEGATTGGLTGGLLGAVIGGLTMVGSVLIPGAGLLVAGPLIGALTGGAIGTATGGLVGALIGAGIPEEEARFYERQLKERGNVLVVAHVPTEQVADVRDCFNRCGAESVQVS